MQLMSFRSWIQTGNSLRLILTVFILSSDKQSQRICAMMEKDENYWPVENGRFSFHSLVSYWFFHFSVFDLCLCVFFVPPKRPNAELYKSLILVFSLCFYFFSSSACSFFLLFENVYVHIYSLKKTKYELKWMHSPMKKRIA